MSVMMGVVCLKKQQFGQKFETKGYSLCWFQFRRMICRLAVINGQKGGVDGEELFDGDGVHTVESREWMAVVSRGF